jgi:hypothetical protein
MFPPANLAHMQSPSFWARFFWDDDKPEECEASDETIAWEFRVDQQHALTLQANLGLRCFSLGVFPPRGGEPIELGWDDDAHWHPHALRWDEVDAVARALAWRDLTLPHPGLVVMLLCRFAPMAEGQDGDLGAWLLEAASRAVPIDASTKERIWRRTDMRHAGVRWREHAQRGFVLEQDETLRREFHHGLYSLRNERPDTTFPFAILKEMVDAARRTASLRAAPWRNDTTLTFATGVLETGDAATLGRLHDALVAAGCDDALFLGACRTEDAAARWPIEHLAHASAMSDHRRRPVRPPRRLTVVSVRVPLAHFGPTTVRGVRETVGRALSEEQAGRVLSYTTEHVEKRLRSMTLSIELEGRPPSGLDVLKRALAAVGAQGATIT